MMKRKNKSTNHTLSVLNWFRKKLNQEKTQKQNYQNIRDRRNTMFLNKSKIKEVDNLHLLTFSLTGNFHQIWKLDVRGKTDKTKKLTLHSFSNS
jgi:hypothetical protein